MHEVGWVGVRFFKFEVSFVMKGLPVWRPLQNLLRYMEFDNIAFIGKSGKDHANEAR